MSSEFGERTVQASAVEQAALFLADLDFLIDAHAEGVLGDEEFDQAKARLVMASPDPEAFLLLDPTRLIPLD